MSVLERFALPVDERNQSQAQAFVQQGAVEIRSVSDIALVAEVSTPNGPETVRLDWSGASLAGSCTCLAGEGEVCAHVVAAALAADAEGHVLIPPALRQTMPRRRSMSAMWLSPTGQLRRTDEEDEPRRVVSHEPSLPGWKKAMQKLRETSSSGASAEWTAERQVVYIVDIPASLDERSVVVRLAIRERKASGEWSRSRTRGVSFPDVTQLADPEDRQLVSLLRGAGGGTFSPSYDPVFRVPETMRAIVLPMMCATGRALMAADADLDELVELKWDAGEPWVFRVEARRDESLEQYVFAGVLTRGEEHVPVARPLLLATGGLVFFPGTVARLDDGGAGQWITLLRQQRSILVPFAQAEELLKEMLTLPRLPQMDLPDELQVQTVRATPRPHLRVRAPGKDEFRPERLRAELSFEYDGMMVGDSMEGGRTVYQASQRRLVIRDEETEQTAKQRLQKMGLREAYNHSRGGPEWWFNHRHLLRVVRSLIQAGWHVEADGKVYRREGKMRLNVSSGIDWFEVRGRVDFDGHTADLPEVLRAIKRGETLVKLDDGTFGMLPERWLKQYQLLADIGDQEEDYLKFAKAQAGLLDALLASEADATWDEGFARATEALRNFEGIGSADAPSGFIGELRPYQRDGLGWFEFLRRFSFGGCLADDMGLGKTVQVLAMLEDRRERRERGEKVGPSLVVVPKSLVFNWQQEAGRFCPNLRLLDHTGIDRIRGADHLPDYDLIITTYGTLRRDATFLKDVDFDYIVLDEAQAVKNPSSESAKAVRLVKGQHRLALSGTPVQNHLGDLWSLFDFLNPGMLGGASVFLGTGSAMRSPDPETRGMLARALRAFILRRTKEQVASDLPPKLEQTIYCELDTEQRRMYDELKEHYRRSLLAHVDREGLNKSRMQILEALLRLRQAALHPGLIDPARTAEPSAKLDMLLPQLEEVIEEGHKALVFSQFTSMLAIVRQRLDREGIVYEYLDGKTTDREARVNRFQSDEKCKLFLISLKAGGLGLNLTAADYVFLLDPWWNPAVEQQAIDRAHRIGQDKQVFACRLIAKDTVEEKVLALQQSKRDLADAIITADNSLIRTLGREELELLLS